MSNLVKHTEFNLDEKKASNIEKSFLPKVEEKEGYEKVYKQIINAEINKETCNSASDLRKKLVKVRTGIGKIHKAEKNYFLQAGKFVDAIKNRLTEPVVQMEEKLSDIENYYENLEKERLQKLQNDRAELLSKYLEDASERDLSSMDDDVWEAYLSTKKKEYEDRIEAERKAEEERQRQQKLQDELNQRQKEIAPYAFFSETDVKLGMSEKEYQSILKKAKDAKAKDDAEKEKQRKENERLKAEAEAERKRQAEIEAKRKKKIEEERKAREAKERKEREKYEAKLKAEREHREKLEREAEEHRLEEEKAKAEAEAKKQAELKKGDADKVKDLINDLENLKTKYQFKSKKYKSKYSDVGQLIDKTINFINK